MSRIGTRTATIAALPGGLLAAFAAVSPTAAADPAPAALSVPGIDVVQQLANTPATSQFLQSEPSMLAPKPAATPAAPASAAPAGAK
jgi:hypothetical protein